MKWEVNKIRRRRTASDKCVGEVYGGMFMKSIRGNDQDMM